ncbi:MAG: septum formation protein [Chitinophagales bacterium]|jgi:septum formation protein
MKKLKIVLASKSPRRKELLGNIVAEFEIRTKEIEEIYPPELDASLVPEYLAKLKASAFTETMADDELIITSDTVVTMNDEIYGKPKDREDAIRILSELSGKSHDVITGVCLRLKDKELVFSETTRIHFKALSIEEIEYYIDNYQPYDKAGAYAIQEWIGMIGIERMEGDYFNVVGLPLFRLNQELKLLGFGTL